MKGFSEWLGLLSFSVASAFISSGLGGELENAPPVVVKTVPQSGSSDVKAGEFTIEVTFSKQMMDQSWSWSTAWEGSHPEMLGKPKYSEDGTTCSLKVKLEAGNSYGFWLNSEKFGNFKDAAGKSAVPYLLVFQTVD